MHHRDHLFLFVSRARASSKRRHNAPRLICPSRPQRQPQEQCFHGTSTGKQSSSRLLSMRDANALLELPQQAGYAEEGARVPALLLARGL